MLNASVGMQRVLTRLRPSSQDHSAPPVRFHRRSIEAARHVRVRATSLASSAQLAPTDVARAAATPLPRRLFGRVGPQAAMPLAVALIVGAASIASWLPGQPARGAIGAVPGDGPDRRIAIGGLRDVRDDLVLSHGVRAADANLTSAIADPEPLTGGGPDRTAFDPDAGIADDVATAPSIGGPFLPDGTLLKPVAVDTVVADGKHLLRSYKVRSGDSLATIADRHDVGQATIWWANRLTSLQLKIGRTLVIPPADGVVVTVRDGDTLESVSKEHGVAADRIYKANKLEDRVLVAGQVLFLPGARVVPIPTPKAPAAPRAPSGGGGGGATGGGGQPASYHGGAMAWPVVGGNNYISQYYRGGHYGLDIAATHGATVRAAAGGTVTFAGWKNNGGGYQVWISHGGGLHTTYNHLASVTVGRGQGVGKAQQVGRVGASGWASGPHLHFEVWRGTIWSGGQRVNPLGYL